MLVQIFYFLNFCYQNCIRTYTVRHSFTSLLFHQSARAGGNSQPPAGAMGAAQERGDYSAWKHDSHLSQPGRSVANSGAVGFPLMSGAFSIVIKVQHLLQSFHFFFCEHRLICAQFYFTLQLLSLTFTLKFFFLLICMSNCITEIKIISNSFLKIPGQLWGFANYPNNN